MKRILVFGMLAVFALASVSCGPSKRTTSVTKGEKEVNLILAEYHDDFCTLRRGLVDEGLLARDRTGYWRVRQ